MTIQEVLKAATNDRCFVTFHYHLTLRANRKPKGSVDVVESKSMPRCRVKRATFFRSRKLAHTHEISVQKETLLVQDHSTGECQR